MTRFDLVDGKYQPAAPDEDRRFWIESGGLFLGTWIGKKADYEGCWLRWWDKSGNLLLWGGELLEQERQRAEQAEAKSVRLGERLRVMGVDPAET